MTRATHMRLVRRGVKMDSEAKSPEVEEISMPVAESMALRLAAMTLDRDRALLAAAQARAQEAQVSIIGIGRQIAESEAAVKKAEAALLAAITDGGAYQIAQESLAVDAATVKRRRASP